MKHIFTRTAAALMAASMALSFASCSDKKDTDSHNEGNLAAGNPEAFDGVSQENLPYGATVTQLTPDIDGVPVMTEYDNRYLTAEEGTLVCNYFAGIALKDADMFSSAVYPPYLEFRLKTLNGISTEEFVEGQYETVNKSTGGDFEFTYIMITDCLREGEFDNFSAFDNILLDMNPDAKITERKYLQIDCMYNDTTNGGNYSLKNRLGGEISLCLYTIDGKPYLLT